ncbi:MAG: hypothetical protein KAV82_16840 [Phycisphaerae bacterium]|nr:hypothetical protein [Phycisphaerae bacterium]
MSKRSKRWPIWKIAAAGILCVLVAGGLFWLSSAMKSLDQEDGGEADNSPSGILELPGFVQILGMGLLMIAMVFFVWLGLRVKEARTPPWERKRKSKRR